MNLLVDTHALLWFVSGDSHMSRTARETIEHPDTTNYVSIASWWEIAVKCSLDRLKLDDPLDVFLARRTEEGFRVLSIETRHLPPLIDLPFHHRDPFDRLIICQAIAEDMPICTADTGFKPYPVHVLW
ncbi:MAG: type II toxin-antitoxin system VapC family toxin [Kiritimatiellae bacterium]|nr:type II toxin-antitoxin system VapC family toxin [Kiritimatiellia bacterium]